MIISLHWLSVTSKHLSSLWSDEMSEQAMKSSHLSTINILNINTCKNNTINVFRRQDSCQSLIIKMFSHLAHGQSAGVGPCGQYLHLCMKYALRGCTQAHDQSLRLSDAFGEQEPATWDPVELFWRQWRQCRRWLPSVSVWFASYSCAGWKVHTIAHHLASSMFPSGVPLFRIAQICSLICLS